MGGWADLGVVLHMGDGVSDFHVASEARKEGGEESAASWCVFYSEPTKGIACCLSGWVGGWRKRRRFE